MGRPPIPSPHLPDGSVDRLYFSRHIKEKVTSLSSILVSDEYKAEKDRFRAQFNR